jgi:dTDP-4-dehydrorhamnose reductase
MRIAILGAGGQLAHDLLPAMADQELFPLPHADLDICDYSQVRQSLEEIKPDLVINTAAVVRVDDCESRVERSFQVNAFAPRHLAQVCQELDCALVQMSTDYIFSGDQKNPYLEDDLPMPLNVYGASKLAGEYFVRGSCQKHFVVRSSGLYGLVGSSGKGGNFVETMIRKAGDGVPIRVVDDQVLSPTYTKDLAAELAKLVSTDAYGLYHITNSGACSWWEFAKRIFELVSLDPEVGSISSQEFGAAAQRPKYSVLGNAPAQAQKINVLRSWDEALEAYLLEKGHIAPDAKSGA